MRAVYTDRFRRSYESAPAAIQAALDRRITLLCNNLRHPSLRAKKYEKSRDIWQARVDGGRRFYFRIFGRHLRADRHNYPP